MLRFYIRFVRDANVFNQHPPGKFLAGTAYEAGFVPPEGYGDIRFYATAHERTGIGVDPGGRVDGEDETVAATISFFYKEAIVSRDFAMQADAEDTINQDVIVR